MNISKYTTVRIEMGEHEAEKLKHVLQQAAGADSNLPEWVKDHAEKLAEKILL